MKRLAIIDGKSVFYRGYYAMPNLALPDGTPTGGVYGFAVLSLELIKKLQPDFVIVAWDKPKTNIRKRKELYPEYKAGRKPAPPDFYVQIPLLHELLEALNWPLIELDDYEADDIMGSLARQATDQNIETCLISSDLDMLQIVDHTVELYALKRGFSQIEQFSIKSFEQKYDIRVDQFLDLKALKGDSSDNIPGVPGIGEKTGIELLKAYGTLDNIYSHIDEIKPAVQKKLLSGKDSAYLSKKLATIWSEAPASLDLEKSAIANLDQQALSEILKKLEFTSLLKDLPTVLGSSGGGSAPSVRSIEQVDCSKELLTEFLMLDRVLFCLDGDSLVISSRDKWTECHPVEAMAILQNLPVISFDGNELGMKLLENGAKLPQDLYDIRQAEFLLRPLRRSHAEADITGYEGDETGVRLAHLWRIYDEQMADFTKSPKILEVARTLDFPMINILVQMQTAGIKLDTVKLGEINQTVVAEIESIRQDVYQLAGGEFNLASPMQLAEVLFTKLQLPTAGIKKGKTGYSTGQKELDKLRDLHPIISLIERFRELEKLRNTYLETLPKLVDGNSRLHTLFDQSVASTGRLSSANPNLQNIPVRTELGRKIREAFVPHEGNVFIGADYSQFELRLVAVLANDEAMIEDFNQDIDIHTKTASEAYGIPIDEVSSEQRRHAKVINFGILYGMSPHGLSVATGMPLHEAKQFIDDYFRLRHKVKDYLDATIQRAHTEGFVETLYGRRRPTPDVKSSNFMVRTGAERAAANMPIQGTEADLMKKAMIAIEEWLEVEYGPWSLGNIRPKQILQIHDSVLLECPEAEASKIATKLKEIMEGIAPELPVKLSVDVKIGDNWSET